MVNTPVGVSRPFRPVETVEAPMTMPLRYSVARCVLRSITRNRGPVECRPASQTYWPGRSLTDFSTTDLWCCFEGCAATEAASHASNPNKMRRFMNHLVQVIPRTGPRLRAELYRGARGRPIRNVPERATPHFVEDIDPQAARM